MRIDGPTFAHAFLAVFSAASQDKKSPYHKSIALEIHLHGIQLVANDGRMMLTAYVPDLEHHYDSPPSFDTSPERTIVLNDDDGRGRGLCGYVCQLGTRYRYGFDDYVPGAVELRLDHDQKLPPGAADQETFAGMESVYSSLSVPDREKVFLELVPVSVPDWRGILTRQADKAGSRRVFGLDPEILERLGKARRHAFGALQMTLGATPKSLIRVEYLNSDPYVFGSIVPLEDADADVYPDEPDTELDPAEVRCPRCSYFVMADDDGDGALTEVRHHMSSAHGVNSAADALREIHGLTNNPDRPRPGAAVRTALEKLGATLHEGESLTISSGGKSATIEGKPKTTTKATRKATETAQVDDLAAKRQTDQVAARGREDLDDEGRLLAAAVELVVGNQFGSARMLARKLAIPYARALKVMDKLEQHGVVGPSQGTKARDVLILPDSIREAIASLTEGSDQ